MNQGTLPKNNYPKTTPRKQYVEDNSSEIEGRKQLGKISAVKNFPQILKIVSAEYEANFVIARPVIFLPILTSCSRSVVFGELFSTSFPHTEIN